MILNDDVSNKTSRHICSKIIYKTMSKDCNLLPKEVVSTVQFAVPWKTFVRERTSTVGALHTPHVPRAVQHVQKVAVNNGTLAARTQLHHGKVLDRHLDDRGSNTRYALTLCVPAVCLQEVSTTLTQSSSRPYVVLSLSQNVNKRTYCVWTQSIDQVLSSPKISNAVNMH